MITTLDELVAFTVSEADRRPAVARRILLRSPGCGDEEIRELRDFEPNLPPVYVRCISRLALKGIGLSGFFGLWPGGNVFKGTFVEDFRMVNSPGWYHQREFAQMGLLLVGSWNDADVCVAKRGSASFAVDSVVRFRDGDRCADPVVMCGDFEKFLVAAGNVAEILVMKNETGDEGKTKMLLDRLPSVGITPAEIGAWRDIADVVYEEADGRPA